MADQTVQNYLKAICRLQDRYGRVATTELAAHLRIAAPSTTQMLKKLASRDLVEYRPYYGVVLTAKGRKIAVQILRRHRLLESYFAQALKMPPERVHAEAERWEHVLSPDLEDRIDTMLGHPAVDPHGARIPDKEE